MTYKRFSQLWDVLITNNPNCNSIQNPVFVDACRSETTQALIEYGQGNTEKFDNVRKILGR